VNSVTERAISCSVKMDRVKWKEREGWRGGTDILKGTKSTRIRITDVWPFRNL
jgi:hypothetical protein